MIKTNNKKKQNEALKTRTVWDESRHEYVDPWDESDESIELKNLREIKTEVAKLAEAIEHLQEKTTSNSKSIRNAGFYLHQH